MADSKRKVTDRPTRIDALPIDPHQLREFAELGMSLKAIAAKFGLSAQGLRSRFDDYPGLRVSYEEGRADLQEKLARRMNELTEDIDDGFQATKFLLKARCGWRDGDPPKHISERNREEIEDAALALLRGILAMSPEARAKRLKELQAARDADAE